MPNPVARSCSFCHSTNRVHVETCYFCGHDAQVPRFLCRCPRCAGDVPAHPPTTAADVEAAIAELGGKRAVRTHPKPLLHPCRSCGKRIPIDVLWCADCRDKDVPPPSEEFVAAVDLLAELDAGEHSASEAPPVRDECLIPCPHCHRRCSVWNAECPFCHKDMTSVLLYCPSDVESATGTYDRVGYHSTDCAGCGMPREAHLLTRPVDHDSPTPHLDAAAAVLPVVPDLDSDEAVAERDGGTSRYGASFEKIDDPAGWTKYAPGTGPKRPVPADVLPQQAADARQTGEAYLAALEADLIDRFACAAMPGLLERCSDVFDPNLAGELAKQAYVIARAMIAERKKVAP